MAHRFTTDLLLSFGGYETSFPVVVEYWHHKARPAYTPRGEYAPIDPPEPEHVEIGCVYIDRGEGHRDPLPEWMIEGMTESLEALCLEDWRDRDSYAREQAAGARHEEMRLERAWQPRAAE